MYSQVSENEELDNSSSIFIGSKGNLLSELLIFIWLKAEGRKIVRTVVFLRRSAPRGNTSSFSSRRHGSYQSEIGSPIFRPSPSGLEDSPEIWSAFFSFRCCLHAYVGSYEHSGNVEKYQPGEYFGSLSSYREFSFVVEADDVRLASFPAPGLNLDASSVPEIVPETEESQTRAAGYAWSHIEYNSVPLFQWGLIISLFLMALGAFRLFVSLRCVLQRTVA